MSATEPQDDTPADDFASRLEELHLEMALAISSSSGSKGAEDEERLRRAQDCLRLIERVRRNADHPSTDSDRPVVAETWTGGDDELPQRIGRFQILRRLGQGGNGVVFLAHDPQLKRQVALKVPHPEALLSGDWRRRFLREGEAAAALDHPHIVSVHEAQGIGAICYIASAYCEGISLADWLTERQPRPLPPRAAARLVLTLAEAVQHAHSRGVLHRDIKPSNILLERPPGLLEGALDATTLADLARLTDFGLARLIGDDTEATRSGAIVGTPAYMAPEQADGRVRQIDVTTDVYGLGAVLYELLTGEAPFRRATALETLQAVRLEEPRRLARPGLLIPADLEAICLKCLEKSQGKRYPTAEALAEDLRSFLDDRPVSARRPGAINRLLRWGRRRPAVAALTAAVGLLGMALVVGSMVAAVWLNEARLEAEASADQAREDRDRVQDALDAMTSQVALDWLTAQRELSPDQKKFLQNAVNYYREFAAETAVDEKGRARVAGSALRLGRILERLGQLEDAAKAYQQAEAGFSQLVSDFPEHPRHRQQLATALFQQAFVARLRSRWTEADAALRRSLAMRQELARRHPQEPDFRADLAAAHSDLGILLRMQGQHAESEKEQRESARLREELVAEFPNDPDHRRNLSISLNNLAVVLVDLKRHQDALPVTRRSVELKEQLAQEFPDIVKYQDDLGHGFGNFGALLLMLKQKSEAKGMFERAVAVYRVLTAKFPSIPLYRRQLGQNCHNVAAVHCEAEQWAQAESQQTEAIAILERLTADFPNAADYELSLGDAYRQQGNIQRDQERETPALEEYDKAVERFDAILARQPKFPIARQRLLKTLIARAQVRTWTGRCSEAMEDWNRVLALAPEPHQAAWRMARRLTETWAGNPHPALAEADAVAESDSADGLQLYFAAAIHSVASKASGDAATRQRHLDQAFTILQRALDRGYRDEDTSLQRDRSLEPLRSDPRFSKLQK
jgi:tetratricopeptide (TPR) repeat protein